MLTDNEECRTHGGDDARGHHTERDICGKPPPNEFVFPIPAQVTRDHHRVGNKMTDESTSPGSSPCMPTQSPQDRPDR